MVFYVNCLCSQKSKSLSRMKNQSWGFLGSFCLEQGYNQGPSRSQIACCAAALCTQHSPQHSSSLHTPSFRQPPERSDSNIFHILLLELMPYRTVSVFVSTSHTGLRTEHASRTRTKSHLFNPRPRTTTKQKQLSLFTSFLFLGRAPLLRLHWNPGAFLRAEALRNSK